MSNVCAYTIALGILAGFGFSGCMDSDTIQRRQSSAERATSLARTLSDNSGDKAREPLDDLVVMARSRYHWDRMQFCMAVGRNRLRQSELLVEVERLALQDPEWVVRSAAVTAVGDAARPGDASAIQTLTMVLARERCSGRDYVWYAIFGLGELCEDKQELARILNIVSGCSDPNTRRAVDWVLNKGHGQGARAPDGG